VDQSVPPEPKVFLTRGTSLLACEGAHPRKNFESLTGEGKRPVVGRGSSSEDTGLPWVLETPSISRGEKTRLSGRGSDWKRGRKLEQDDSGSEFAFEGGVQFRVIGDGSVPPNS